MQTPWSVDLWWIKVYLLVKICILDPLHVSVKSWFIVWKYHDACPLLPLKDRILKILSFMAALSTLCGFVVYMFWIGCVTQIMNWMHSESKVIMIFLWHQPTLFPTALGNALISHGLDWKYSSSDYKFWWSDLIRLLALINLNEQTLTTRSTTTNEPGWFAQQ